MLVKNIEIFLKKRKKKWKHGGKLYENLPNNEKQRLVEYRKNYCKMKKNKDWLMFGAIL